MTTFTCECVDGHQNNRCRSGDFFTHSKTLNFAGLKYYADLKCYKLKASSRAVFLSFLACGQHCKIFWRAKKSFKINSADHKLEI